MSRKIIILMVLLVTVFTSFGCNTSKEKPIGIGYSYNDNNFSTGNKSFTDNINVIEIDWVIGEVNITPSKNEELIIREDTDKDIEDIYQMRYYLDGTTLRIKSFGSLEIVDKVIKRKILNVFIPRNSDLEIIVDSNDNTGLIEGLNVKTLKYNSNHGDISINNCVISQCILFSRSGDINISSTTIDSFEGSNIDGDTIVLDSKIIEMNFSSNTGEIALSFSIFPTRSYIQSLESKILLYITKKDYFKITYQYEKDYFICDEKIDYIKNRENDNTYSYIVNYLSSDENNNEFIIDLKNGIIKLVNKE